MVYYKPEQERWFEKYISAEKASYALLTAVGLLIAALLFFTFLWLKAEQELETQLARNELLEQEREAALRVKEGERAVEWTTYRNALLNYEISYPKDWNVREPFDHATFEPPAQFLAGEEAAISSGLFFVTVRENPEQLDIERWLEQTDEPGIGVGSFDRFLSSREVAEFRESFQRDRVFRLDYSEKAFFLSGMTGLEQYLETDGGSARVIYLPSASAIYILTVSSERHFNPSRQDPSIVKFLEITNEMVNSFKLVR